MSVNESTFDTSFLQNDGMGGFEGITSETVAIPFVRVLQALSPVCKKKNDSYVEGAEEGKLFNSVNKRVIDTPCEVIVGRFDRYFIAWKPERQGFAGAFSTDVMRKMLEDGTVRVAQDNRIYDAQGNHYSDTYVYYVVFPEFLQDGVCIISLSSTQIKAAKKWNRMLTTTQYPGTTQKALPWHMRWTITTPQMSNEQGDWAGFDVEFAGFINQEQQEVLMEERKTLPQAAERTDFRQLAAGEGAEDGTYDATAESKF